VASAGLTDRDGVAFAPPLLALDALLAEGGGFDRKPPLIALDGALGGAFPAVAGGLLTEGAGGGAFAPPVGPLRPPGIGGAGRPFELEFPGTFGAAPIGADFAPPAAPSIIGALASLIFALAGFSFAPFVMSVRSAPLPGCAFTAGGRLAGGAGGGGGGGMVAGFCQKAELIRTTLKQPSEII
jgi:hypothetical protein